MRWISGYLARLLLFVVIGLVLAWAFIVALNPWALHIGGRATPLLYWHGAGTVQATSGKAFPLYVWFSPGRPGGFSTGGRREGKMVSARLQGDGWLCLAPGTVERMDVSGTMYGGYTSDSNSLLDFRLLERRRPFAINPQRRGFFDVAGGWRGPDLVLDRPNEQGIRFVSGLLIEHAVVTLQWASYNDFEAVCDRPR
ncbi:MAG TPA: hypothetical protein VGH34_18090 [Vicinamibacterales bacterium]|jgi:hypothetical protein